MSMAVIDKPVIATCLNGAPLQGADGRSMSEADPSDWAKVFTAIAAAGFHYAELSDAWIRPADMTPARRHELVETARSCGVELPSLHVQRASVIQPGIGQSNLAYAHASIDAAAEMGMKVFSTGLHQPLSPSQRKAFWFWLGQGPVDPPDDPERWQTAVRRIRELGRHANDAGMVMSLEMYEDTYLGRADSAVHFVSEVGLPNVGLNPDVGNLVRLHRRIDDWRETYRKTLPYAVYWHLKNYQRDEAPDGSWHVAIPTTLRDGIIDYRWAVHYAQSCGYQGMFICEHYGGDVLSVCAHNAGYLQKLLSRP